jgi:hypothetical protein
MNPDEFNVTPSNCLCRFVRGTTQCPYAPIGSLLMLPDSARARDKFYSLIFWIVDSSEKSSLTLENFGLFCKLVYGSRETKW